MKRTILKKPSEIKRWFSVEAEIYAFDFEATGLSYLDMEPVGVSFADGSRACYVDLWENPHVEEICRCLGGIFNGNKFIAHNLKFDYKCWHRFIHRSAGDSGSLGNGTNFCTFIASYLLDENRYRHSLKVLAKDLLGISESNISKWEDADSCGRHSDKFYEYAINDSIWAYRLYKLFKPQLTKQGLDHLFYNIEMPFVQVNAEMEINGIKVDTGELFKLQSNLEEKIIEVEDKMLESIGMKASEQHTIFGDAKRIIPVNFNSNNQLVNIIEKKCGLSIKETTASGKKSVGKETLAGFKDKHPFIGYLSDYKKLTKLMNGYVIPAWDMIDKDGRMRPSFGIVKTGRLNCTKPNLQQLPNRAKDPDFVARYPDLDYRSIFIAEEGHCLVGGDYSGQELRVLAEITKDATMIDAFNRNLDLHLMTANSAFNLGLSEKSLENDTPEHKEAKSRFTSERDKGKNGINFPIVYGTSAYGISNRQNISKQLAQEWIDAFHNTYQDVKPAIILTTKTLQNKGYVTTMMGRRRRLRYNRFSRPAEKARMERQAFNFKIQGFSADQMKIAACRANRAGLKVLLIVHDELVLEAPSRNVEKVKSTLRDCMVNAVSLSIPFEVEINSGHSYSEIK